MQLPDQEDSDVIRNLHIPEILSSEEHPLLREQLLQSGESFRPWTSGEISILRRLVRSAPSRRITTRERQGPVLRTGSVSPPTSTSASTVKSVTITNPSGRPPLRTPLSRRRTPPRRKKYPRTAGRHQGRVDLLVIECFRGISNPSIYTRLSNICNDCFNLFKV